MSNPYWANVAELEVLERRLGRRQKKMRMRDEEIMGRIGPGFIGG